MSEYQYDICVFCCRAQIPHRAHQEIILEGLRHAKNVVVVLGSASSPRSIYNPFTFEEREVLLKSSFNQSEIEDRIFCLPIVDTIYNDQTWVEAVRNGIKDLAASQGWLGTTPLSIAIIGHMKKLKEHRPEQYYRKMFPDWEPLRSPRMPTPRGKRYYTYTSSEFRSLYFEYAGEMSAENLARDFVAVPEGVAEFLSAFAKSKAYDDLTNEYEFIRKYRQKWETAPFPPIFFTVDTVLVCGGHVLLVERASTPGKGLLSLPGGFIRQEETSEQAFLRNLKRNTLIEVPDHILLNSVVTNKVFDDPNRSSLGRNISHTFLVHMFNEVDLPHVSEDCGVWTPISDVDSSRMFDDHYSIIRKMMGEL